MDEVERLQQEVDRLKAGQFTEEEFQNLCHNTSVDEGFERFAQGCVEYQKKLFGRTALGGGAEAMIAALEAIAAASGDKQSRSVAQAALRRMEISQEDFHAPPGTVPTAPPCLHTCRSPSIHHARHECDKAAGHEGPHVFKCDVRPVPTDVAAPVVDKCSVCDEYNHTSHPTYKICNNCWKAMPWRDDGRTFEHKPYPYTCAESNEMLVVAAPVEREQL